MALRLPLQPSPQSAWAVAHERLALGTRKPQQFIDITERVLCCVRLSGILAAGATRPARGAPGARGGAGVRLEMILPARREAA